MSSCVCPYCLTDAYLSGLKYKKYKTSVHKEVKGESYTIGINNLEKMTNGFPKHLTDVIDNLINNMCECSDEIRRGNHVIIRSISHENESYYFYEWRRVKKTKKVL